jgi:Ser/Thr protein kinase RdoA (MazF antagonist)
VATELGTLLGRLHVAAPRSAEPLGPWYRTVPATTVWADLVGRGVGRAWQPSMAAQRAELDRLGDLVRSAPPPSGPLVVGHRDLHPDNVLVDPDGQLVPVDWEDVGPMVPDRELAKVLVQWHVDGDRIDEPAVRHTLAAYRAAGGTGEVRTLESFTMLVSGELNFLAERAGMSLDPGLGAQHVRHAVSEALETLSWLPSVGTLERVLRIAHGESAGT